MDMNIQFLSRNKKKTPSSRVLVEKLVVAKLAKKSLYLLWNPKGHYLVYNSPPADPNFSELRPI
jgi:hypothetical protein